MKKITYQVIGMRCGMCETTVNDIVRKFNGIKKVNSNRHKKETVVICEESVFETDIQKAIQAHGYDCPDYTVEPYEKKGLFSFLKRK